MVAHTGIGEYDVEKRRMRRVLVAFILGTVVILGLVAGLFHRSEYSFLSELGPTRTFDPGLVDPFSAARPGFRYRVFYFGKNMDSKVMAELQGHFTAARGYTSRNVSDRRNRMVAFGTTSALDEGGVIYFNDGYWKDDVQKCFENADKMPTLEPGGCAVLIAYGPSWWEVKWDQFKNFLHLGGTSGPPSK